MLGTVAIPLGIMLNRLQTVAREHDLRIGETEKRQAAHEAETGAMNGQLATKLDAMKDSVQKIEISVAKIETKLQIQK